MIQNGSIQLQTNAPINILTNVWIWDLTRGSNGLACSRNNRFFWPCHVEMLREMMISGLKNSFMFCEVLLDHLLPGSGVQVAMAARKKKREADDSEKHGDVVYAMGVARAPVSYV